MRPRSAAAILSIVAFDSERRSVAFALQPTFDVDANVKSRSITPPATTPSWDPSDAVARFRRVLPEPTFDSTPPVLIDSLYRK